MRMSDAELKKILAGNPALKVRELDRTEQKRPKQPAPRPTFDSQAEERYYLQYIRPGLQSGIIAGCELHKTFELLPAIHYNGKHYKNRVYTPDFYLEYRDGTVEVIEIKGKQIKKWQRDYPIRRHLFIMNFCIPNNWTFREVMAEEV